MRVLTTTLPVGAKLDVGVPNTAPTTLEAQDVTVTPPVVPGDPGEVIWNDAGALTGSTFTTDGESLSDVANINGLRQPVYAPVALTDGDEGIIASNGSFYDLAVPITDNRIYTMLTFDSPRIGIVVAIRRFDHSAFTVTIQLQDTTPLWVFATNEQGEVDVRFTGVNWELAGVRLFQEP